MKTLRQLVLLFKEWINPATQNNPRLILYRAALDFIGKDVTPDDLIPDEYACAATINALHEKAFGFPIGGESSTYKLYGALKSSPYFKKVDEPLEGTIIISPTGYKSGKSNITNGHVGIVMEYGKIAANDSFTGKFIDSRYTVKSWREKWGVQGKYPVHFFTRI